MARMLIVPGSYLTVSISVVCKVHFQFCAFLIFPDIEHRSRDNGTLNCLFSVGELHHSSAFLS